MSFYTDIQDEAENLIIEFGTSISVRRGTVSIPDPLKPYIKTTVNDDTVTVGVFTNIDSTNIDGTNVKRGDLNVLIAHKHLGFEPLISHKIVYGSIVYEIISVTSYNPGGTPIYYEVQVRK